jgi:hypothetical protein
MGFKIPAGVEVPPTPERMMANGTWSTAPTPGDHTTVNDFGL